MSKGDRSGAFGWLGIFGFVVSYDIWAILSGKQTLSSACWRASTDPMAKAVIFSVWAGVTYHLFVEGHVAEIAGAIAEGVEDARHQME